MNQKISILGCGWYGLELAKLLIEKKYLVKGSTTSPAKLHLLDQEGIAAHLLDLGVNEAQIDTDFFESDVLIISIPPKKSASEQHLFVDKIKQVIKAINCSTIQNVIFISSTAVYGDHNKSVNEDELVKPVTDSGKAIVTAEQLLKEQEGFQTTVLRFAGLIGPGRNPGRFFAGKTNIPNGAAPVNLIHLDDCISLTYQIIKQNAYGYTFNACSPDHLQKQDFYTQASLKAGLEKPVFINELKDWKIIDGSYTNKILNYNYLVASWGDWLKSDKP
ncbi:SDR family oxidoreductase [Pedobacter sp. MC2016-24]|uniref:SDR family oxidoreductase n=1 Tax=Pedobacter sp. MC2016-24 TaxID=2780090 RepID=UPI00187F2E22|nr:SDR family oxidoreductase [Pedobacter sp. MC2016-24]MBE9600992.1 SDR family oxidoreductase [Pedobacter sp. MC2016-24]